MDLAHVDAASGVAILITRPCHGRPLRFSRVLVHLHHLLGHSTKNLPSSSLYKMLLEPPLLDRTSSSCLHLRLEVLLVTIESSSQVSGYS